MTPPNATAQSPWRWVVWLVVASGSFLWAIEVLSLPHRGISLEDYGVPLGTYLFGLFALTAGLFAVHMLPAIWLGQAIARICGKVWVPALLFAAIFALSWQHTLVQGDGIRSMSSFYVLQIMLWILAPFLLGLFVWSVLLSKLIGRRLGQYLVVAILVGGVIFNLTVLQSYRTFHGHLAFFNGALFVWLLYPLRHSPALRRGMQAMAVLSAASVVFTLSQGEAFLRPFERFSSLPAAMMTVLPLGKYLSNPADPVIDFDVEWSDDDDHHYQAQFDERLGAIGATRRGNNVILIVLETVRWDHWNDPVVTPRFHQWKHHGTYVPDAVAQYPATPLAYGAIFMSQPPSVLAASSYWGRHRLFDEIVDEFDHLILSQPDISWFEHTAITDFFISRDMQVERHRTARQALLAARRNLARLPEGESFLTWLHLYEPHDPYELRPEFARGGNSERNIAYRSEIAYVDEVLGDFMDWFFESPLAEDTLVVVVADHGEGMGEVIFDEVYWGHHVHVNNVVSRIPMFFSGPDLPGQTTDIVTSQMDVMPTIYDFLGRQMPRRLYPQGDSIYRLLEEPADRPIVTEAFSIRGQAFFDFVAETSETDDADEMESRFREITDEQTRYAPKIALQYGDHKLIYDRILRQYWLYDIVADPYETRDLVDEDRATFLMMEDRLNAWFLKQSWVVDRLGSLD